MYYEGSTMTAIFKGFADEFMKLAADMTPSQPVMTDQRAFAGVSSQMNSRTGIKALLPTSAGHLATRTGSSPPRTTPSNMLREAR